MNLVFIDETQFPGDNRSYGVTAVLVNSTKYPLIVRQFRSLLDGVGWSSKEEFKGSYIFSRSKGDSQIEVSQRVKLTDGILDACKASRNRRLRGISVAYNRLGKGIDNYLRLLRSALLGLPFQTVTNSAKHLTAVYLDSQTGFTLDGVSEVVSNALEVRKVMLLEDVCILHSRPRHLGLALADILGYIAMACQQQLGPESFQGILAFTPQDRKQHCLDRWYAMAGGITIRECN